MATNVIKRLNKDGSTEDVAFYDGQLSALYAMELFVCHCKHWNIYDIKKHYEAKKLICVVDTANTMLLFVDEDSKYCIEANELHKDIYEGTYGSELDFEK